jgi:hypothetical protein
MCIKRVFFLSGKCEEEEERENKFFKGERETLLFGGKIALVIIIQY